MLIKHTCHAIGCNKAVPPKLLMCGTHWRIVPAALRAKVYLHYRPGQEIDKNPTAEYLLAAKAAINAVAAVEGRNTTTQINLDLS